VVAHRPGDADAARLGQRFQARRDIDAVAKDLVFLGDDVTEVDADAKPDAPLVGQIGLAIDHPTLHFGGAARRVDDASEFREQAITRVLDDVPPVLLDLRIDELPEMCLEALVRSFLVRPIRRE
jgi:hypothetical protein